MSQVLGFNPLTSEIDDTIELPTSAGPVADIAFDKNFDILYVLTDNGMLHFQL